MRGGDLGEKATDWESYYSARKCHTSKINLSSITRKISQMIILGLLRRFAGGSIDRICEFGGGDSCFYSAFRKIYQKAYYKVLDNSKNGVNAFNAKYKSITPFMCDAQKLDLLTQKGSEEFDIVFSVGLIEHFDKCGTREMVQKHFAFAKPNGIVLITYPTPTLLYRIIRKIAEALKIWRFHDERALMFNEVHSSASQFGELLARRLNFAIGLKQEILVYKKY